MFEEVSKRINDIIKSQDSKHQKNISSKSHVQQDYPRITHKSTSQKERLNNSTHRTPSPNINKENSSARKQKKDLGEAKYTQNSGRNIESLSPKSQSYTNIQQLRMKSEQSQGIINLVYGILAQMEERLNKRVQILENEFRKIILRVQVLEDCNRLQQENIINSNIINSNTSFRQQNHRVRNSDSASIQLNQTPTKRQQNQLTSYRNQQNNIRFYNNLMHQNGKMFLTPQKLKQQLQINMTVIGLGQQLQILSMRVSQRISELQMIQRKSKCNCENLLEDIIKTQDYLLMEMKCIKYFNKNKQDDIKVLRSANKKYRDNQYLQKQ